MLDDKDIVENFKIPHLQKQAFNFLIKKYQQRVYWHIRKMVIDHDDADDITQDTFVKIWKNLAEFRGDSQLFTWIFKIATNECLAFLNNKKKQVFNNYENLEAELSNKLTSSDTFAVQKFK